MLLQCVLPWRAHSSAPGTTAWFSLFSGTSPSPLPPDSALLQQTCILHSFFVFYNPPHAHACVNVRTHTHPDFFSPDWRTSSCFPLKLICNLLCGKVGVTGIGLWMHNTLTSALFCWSYRGLFVGKWLHSVVVGQLNFWQFWELTVNFFLKSLFVGWLLFASLKLAIVLDGFLDNWLTGLLFHGFLLNLKRMMYFCNHKQKITRFRFVQILI